MHIRLPPKDAEALVGQVTIDRLQRQRWHQEMLPLNLKLRKLRVLLDKLKGIRR